MSKVCNVASRQLSAVPRSLIKSVTLVSGLQQDPSLPRPHAAEVASLADDLKSVLLEPWIVRTMPPECIADIVRAALRFEELPSKKSMDMLAASMNGAANTSVTRGLVKSR